MCCWIGQGCARPQHFHFVLFQRVTWVGEKCLADQTSSGGWLPSCVCMYSRSPDEAAHNTRLPDSISSFSCHLGWAVNTNKLIRLVLQIWCCRLRGVLVHIHTSYLLTIYWVVDVVVYKWNWFCLSLYLKKKKKRLKFILNSSKQMHKSVKMVLTKLLNVDRYLQFKLSHNPQTCTM